MYNIDTFTFPIVLSWLFNVKIKNNPRPLLWWLTVGLVAQCHFLPILASIALIYIKIICAHMHLIIIVILSISRICTILI